MNRRERRVQKRKMRRIGVAVASLAMLGATVGLSGVASATSNGGGRYYECYPGPNSQARYTSSNRNFTYTNYSVGNAYNACWLQG